MMQVQNKLDEEKKAASSWRGAVKMREAALVEGRKILADHMTKVVGLQAVEIEQIPIPEDVDMEDGHGGKKRRGFQLRP